MKYKDQPGGGAFNPSTQGAERGESCESKASLIHRGSSRADKVAKKNPVLKNKKKQENRKKKKRKSHLC